MMTVADKTSMPLRFGTDGWRAIIGDEYTFANVERVSQAYADYLKGDRRGRASASDQVGSGLVVIGYDRRFLSKEFALRAAEIMQGNEFEVLLFDQDVPTPLVSWSVRDRRAEGGIVITASHNSAEFNGFKIKAPWGGSAPTSVTKAVENCLDLSGPRRDKAKLKSIASDGVVASYRRQVSDYIDLDRIRSKSGSLVVDPMHGAGGTWVESFVRDGNLKVETIRGERDPMFGGVDPEPIDRHLKALKSRVRETRALLGVATDGDADRLGAVNELGDTMTMHEVAPLLLLHLIRQRKMTGAVVTTFSQSVVTKRIAASYGLKLFETPIGFKYIAELMLTNDILIGAEESGGIGVKGHLPERDGILMSLLMLEAVVAGEKPPSEIVREIQREFGEFYFDRRDFHMEVAPGQDLASQVAFAPPLAVAGNQVSSVETTDGTKLIFSDESWLLFRQSGTEPVLRLYSEATSREKVQNLLDGGVTIASAAH